MYDDFYNEPSEFEMQIEEFKDGLRKAVKQEYISEIENLKEQLAELREIKDSWNSKVAELNKAKAEAEHAQRDAMKRAKKIRLSELLENCFQTAWGVTTKSEYISEKCEKCDENGYIRFTSPQGTEYTEYCNCRKRIRKYVVTEAELVKIRGDNHKTHVKPDIYFKYCRCKNYYGDDVDEFETVTNFSDDKPFEKIENWERLFHDKEKAQAYCDWLNNKEA